MKLSCTQENLNRGLSIVSRLVTAKTALPILSNVLLVTDKGRLKLAATDLEIGVNSWVGAKIEKEGAITIPAKLFSEFVATNTDKKIDLEVEDHTLHISSEHYDAHIKGIVADEFPLIPQVKREKTLSLPANLLVLAIEQTAFAAALDETRPVLSGILFDFNSGALKIVATDSYRLSETTLSVKKNNTPNRIIVPQRTMLELARIVTEKDSDIELVVGENQAQFSTNDTQLVSRLIEGSFPDYQQIIPKNVQTKVKVNRAQFLNAIRMASYFAREAANNIRLKVASSEVQLNAVSPQIGDNTARLTAEVEGEGLQIAFNAKFLADALSAIRSEKVLIELAGKLSPAQIKPAAGAGFLHIIMPLRLEGD